jgi:hypothetical protein
MVTHPVAVYAQMRNGVIEAVDRNIAEGATASGVASVVLQALTSRSPQIRYPVGREAKLVTRLRAFAPSKLFDRGLRKQFGLIAA